MKKTNLFILAMAVISTACNKEIPENVKSGKENMIDVVFAAQSDDTKTVLDGTTVKWVKGDSISVIWGTAAENKTTAYAAESGASTTFAAKVAEADNYYAVYPASVVASKSSETGYDLLLNVPKTQHGNFAECNITVASTTQEAMNLPFKNLCALVKFELSRDDIKEVRFKGNDSEPVVGDGVQVKLGTTPSIVSVTTPRVETIIKPVGTTAFAAGTYYFAILPGQFSTGFTFKATTTASKVISKSTNKNFTFVRSQAVAVGTIDEVSSSSLFATPEGAGNKSGDSWGNALDCKGFMNALANCETATTFYCGGGDYIFGSSTANFLTLNYETGVGLTVKGGYDEATGERTKKTNFSGNGQYAILDVLGNTNITFENCGFINAISKDGDAPHRALVVNASGVSVTLNACRFCNNKETGAKGGPAIFVKSGKVYADDCIFEQNEATSQGGAIRVDGDNALLFANKCVFYNNKIGAKATYGSVMFVKGNVGFNDCTFYGNNEPEGINQPVMNINYNVILTNNMIFGASNYSSGTGLIRCETAADYSAIAINNIMTNTYAGSNKSYAILYSKTNKTFVSGGYNMYAAKDASVSSTTNYPIAETDVEKKPADVTYSFDSSTYTLTVDPIAGYTPATSAQVKKALEGYKAPTKGITTIGTDFIAWLIGLGEL